MIYSVVTPPSALPVTVAEAVQYCRIDASNQEPAPSAPTVALASPAASGNVDNGVHRYRIVFGTADGKTEGGVISSAVTVADKTVNGQVELTNIPLGGSLVTYREIYRTEAGGGTYLLLATLADNTTTSYTDNIADSALGAESPATNTTADPLLTQWIQSATSEAELYLHRKLITQTLDIYFDRFPLDYLSLPPLQSVTTVTYVDTDGVSQTWSSSLYLVDSVRKPARLEPAYGESWPSTRKQLGAVVVRAVVGYGNASDVPQSVKTWILMRVKHSYDNRAPTSSYSVNEFPYEFVNGLLDSERVLART